MSETDFERLYAAHAASLLRFLEVRLGDPLLAEDIVADTFERVYRSRRPFRARPGGGTEKTWLYTIALNRVRDIARRQQVVERASVSVPAGAVIATDELDAVHDRDVVRRALRALSDEEREAIGLRFGADLTVPEIAKLLDISLTTAEGRVYRALRKLRDELTV